MSVNVVFQSAWLKFSGNETVPVEVHHNLGYCPKVISLECSTDEGVTVGIPALKDENGINLPGPYMRDCQDINCICVYKPNVFTYSGKFRVTIYN
jgi:hypothetical protein